MCYVHNPKKETGNERKIASYTVKRNEEAACIHGQSLRFVLRSLDVYVRVNLKLSLPGHGRPGYGLFVIVNLI